MANTTKGLKPKHYKALSLWEEGILSLKEIAGACEIPVDTMYDLFEGDTKKCGELAHLFKSELDKITTRTASKVRHLVKDNKKIALLMMNDRLKALREKEDRTATDTKEIVSLMNTLNKATPGVEIGNFNALHINRGMTPEEMLYEFRRLTALAQHTFKRGGVSKPPKGEAGGISDFAGD